MTDYLPQRGKPEELEAIDVTAHITSRFPPVFLMTANGDFLKEQAPLLAHALKLDLAFLTALHLFSTILIVAANLVVGQLIERTHTLAGMALKEDQGLWFAAMLAIALFTALTILLRFQFTRERVTEESAGGYDQNADAALNTLGQSAAARSAISVSYIWVETVAYAVCAVLIFLWTVEKDLPEEQAAIARRKK